MAEQGTHKPLVVCSNHILAIDSTSSLGNVMVNHSGINRMRRARTDAEPVCLGRRFSI